MRRRSCSPHVDDAPNAVPGLHVLKGRIDRLERLPMRDELVDLELPGHVVVHQVRQLRAAFDAAKCTAFPDPTGDQLKS